MWLLTFPALSYINLLIVKIYCQVVASIFILLFGFIPNAFAQSKHTDTTEAYVNELAFLADIMYNASLPKHREWAAAEFQRTLDKHLESSGVDSLYNFEWIQVKTASDSSFTLISWQYTNGKGVATPYAVLYTKPNTITWMQYKDGLYSDSEYRQFSPSNWPGAVYYNISSVQHEDSEYTLLFGYHGLDGKSRIRVVDVLQIKDEQVRFGAPVFVVKDDSVRPDVQYRKVLKYAAQSNVRVNYDDSLQLIMMDHLIPAVSPDGELTSVPDGSYEAFELRDGKWYFVDKVFHQTQEVPPGAPKPNSEKKDLFGRDPK